jgi:hypothetical protein
VTPARGTGAIPSSRSSRSKGPIGQPAAQATTAGCSPRSTQPEITGIVVLSEAVVDQEKQAHRASEAGRRPAGTRRLMRHRLQQSVGLSRRKAMPLSASVDLHSQRKAHRRQVPGHPDSRVERERNLFVAASERPALGIADSVATHSR